MPNRRDWHLIRRIRRDRLTYLGPFALAFLCRTVKQVKRRGVPGIFIEAGCALGGSTLLIAAQKEKGRELRVYDTFGLIPPPDTKDGPDVHRRYEVIRQGKARGPGGDVYYGYRQDLLAAIRQRFMQYGLPPEENKVHFIQGIYQETLHLQDEQVAFAHIDCDWYRSVYDCLEQILPRLPVGGMVIVDDYYVWSGCRAAVKDYLRLHGKGLKVQRSIRLRIRRVE